MHFDSQKVARSEHASPPLPDEEVLVPTVPELVLLPEELFPDVLDPDVDEPVAHASPAREALPSLHV